MEAFGPTSGGPVSTHFWMVPMRTPLALLRFVAKAGLNALGGGLAGEFAVEVLPDLARDVWRWWGDGKAPEQLRDEAQAVAALPDAEARAAAEQVAAEEAADQPTEVRRRLADYLAQLPAAIRQSQRRPADPTGRTLAAGLRLEGPADVLPLLPVRLPRFRAGDRPAGVGDWELEELLGVGGFSEVWRARNPHLADPVVLKFCLGRGAAEVLRHEAALLGRVARQGRHPGIVSLLDTYLNGDPPCLKYEYVPGGDLAGLIAQWHRAPAASLVEQSTRLMRQLAEIVAFAHRLSPPIVHRDLKPANILLQPTGPGGVALRVTDFGIGGVAAAQAREQTRGGTGRRSWLAAALRGACTPLYASPQQMRGELPDPRDDVHALGVIWYQLLTGDLTSGASPDWRDELAERKVPEAVLRLLGACLASRAERRPADAAVLAEYLGRLLGKPAAAEVPAAAFTFFPAAKGTAPSERPSGEAVVNSLGMRLVPLPAGPFLMGSAEADAPPEERPPHRVTLSRPFYLGAFPVTQREYAAVMGVNPCDLAEANRGGPDHPVEYVSWDEAVEFCKRLSARPAERRAGRVYRLPTEAEWEYACRAGTETAFAFGPSLSSCQANFDGRCPHGGGPRGPYLDRTSPVGSYPPNAWGLYDLHGNVYEWCADWFGPTYYAHSPARDPAGPAAGEGRVLRGGSWRVSGWYCRSALRYRSAPDMGLVSFGFRVAMTLREPAVNGHAARVGAAVSEARAQ
jgi:formylglycine-generating enzyme required for sulfatase activity